MSERIWNETETVGRLHARAWSTSRVLWWFDGVYWVNLADHAPQQPMSEESGE